MTANPKLKCFIQYKDSKISLFIRSFFHSLVRSFVCSFVRSLVRSFVRSFIRSLVRSLVRSFVLRSFIRYQTSDNQFTVVSSNDFIPFSYHVLFLD